MSLMLERRSVRKFTKERVSEEQIKSMLVAAMQAPSANNQQPWEFIVVDHRETLDKMAKTSSGAWMLQDAPLGIVVVMKSDIRSAQMAPQDCAAAVQNILLEAVNLGLGAVWIGVFPISERVSYLTELLHITKGTPFAQIAIGYPGDSKDVTLRYDPERIYHNKME